MSVTVLPQCLAASAGRALEEDDLAVLDDHKLDVLFEEAVNG